MSDNLEERKPGLVKTLRRIKEERALAKSEEKLHREVRAEREAAMKEYRALEARREATLKAEAKAEAAPTHKKLVKTLRSAKDDAARAREVEATLKQGRAETDAALRPALELAAEHDAAVRREEWQARLAYLRSDAKPLAWAFRITAAVAVLSLVVNVVMYSRWSNTRPLVQVGSDTVTRGEYYGALDQADGKGVLNRIVVTDLVNQAAAAAGVSPTEADISGRLGELMRAHPQGIDPNDPGLRKRVGLTIALENLRIRNVKVSDAEVASYYAAHKKEFALPTSLQGTIVASSIADAPRAAQLLQDGEEPAAIAAKSGMHVVGVNGFALNLNGLPPTVSQGVTRGLVAMNPGDTKTFLVGNSAITVYLQSRDDAVLPALGNIHDQVVRQAKLAKAPGVDQEVAALYHAHPPYFDMANYAAYFNEFNTPAPTSAEK